MNCPPGRPGPRWRQGFSESNEFVDLTEVTNPFFLSSGMPLGLTDDVFRLYRATLDRDPDMNGLMGWLDFLGTGQPKVVVAEGFVSSTEFQTTYGGLNDSDFINLLYNNVLDRDADAGGEALLAGRDARRGDAGRGRAGVL